MVDARILGNETLVIGDNLESFFLGVVNERPDKALKQIRVICLDEGLFLTSA
jgi:hypothetical protein